MKETKELKEVLDLVVYREPQKENDEAIFAMYQCLLVLLLYDALFCKCHLVLVLYRAKLWVIWAHFHQNTKIVFK